MFACGQIHSRWQNTFNKRRLLGKDRCTANEFFHLLKTVIQDEAPSHTMQFAQRLRDTADEELVAPLENFVAAAYREPDLAEELGRADEAAEAEVDEETRRLHSNDNC